MTVDDSNVAARRAAIEEELRQELARDRTARPDPLAAVALLCLKCRGLSSADAHFCIHCGTKFNALVAAAPPQPPSSREAPR